MIHRLTPHPIFILLTLLGCLTLLWLAPVPAQGAWIMNGNAYVSGSDIIITPPSNNQIGSAWLDTPMDFAYDFDIALQIYLGNNNAGADGLAIVFHDDPAGTAALGDPSQGGEWIGMFTIWPALAVEIDTYQNGGWGDPVNDHLAVNEYPSTDFNNGPGHAGSAPQDLGNVEDGVEHLLRLVWDQGAGTLAVYFDGVLRTTYSADFINTIFGGQTQLWFGVTGSTGGAVNEQRFTPLMGNNTVSVSKSVNPSSVDPGDPVTYTVTIQNSGAIPANMTQIADLLPAGFTYRSGTSSGLTTSDPAISGQTLTWTGNWILAPGDTRTLIFEADTALVPGLYYNAVTVSGSDFLDLTTGSTAPVTVGSDLSTSTKTVVDINAGDAQPGDTLRYTITLAETSGRAASAVSVTDDIPANVTGFIVTTIPSGAVDNSTGSGTGANGTGRLNVSNISVPANSSVTVEFEVDIDLAAPNGTIIDNTAVITNPTGPGASPAAPTVIVVDPSVPASGSKPLYFYSNPPNVLSRTPPATAQPDVTLDGRGGSATWTLTPTLSASLSINGTVAIPIELYLSRNNRGSNRTIEVRLFSSNLLIDRTVTVDLALSTDANNPTRVTFDMPISNVTLPVGDTLQVTIANLTVPTNREVNVSPEWNGNFSRVVLEADTVINVDTTAFYSTVYPGTTTVTQAAPGQTIYIRSTISDPFGSFDITGALLDVEDPTGTPVISAAAMTEVDDSGLAVKTYESILSIPFGGPEGTWTIRVTGIEGSEGLVTHTRTSTLSVVVPPNIMLVKAADSATADPGQIITYTVQLTNTGGTATNVVVEDDFSPYTALRMAYNGSGSAPFELTPAGLGIAQYSHDDGFSFNSDPLVSGAGGVPAGFDGTVTHWRITASADMGNGVTYIIRYQVVIK